MALTTKRKLTTEEIRIAENLRRIFNDKKKELGLTQEQAAHKLGWSTQGAVSQYLRAVIPLSLEVGLKFAKLLKVEPSEINPEWAEHDRPEPQISAEQQALYDEIKEMRPDQIALLKQLLGQMK